MAAAPLQPGAPPPPEALSGSSTVTADKAAGELACPASAGNRA